MKRCDPCPNPNEICSCILHPSYMDKKRRESRASSYDQINKIAEEISSESGYSLKELKGKSRKQLLSRYRNKAMRRCRKETDATLQEIGDFFNRNHTTVLYAIGNNLHNTRINSDLAKDCQPGYA